MDAVLDSSESRDASSLLAMIYVSIKSIMRELRGTLIGRDIKETFSDISGDEDVTAFLAHVCHLGGIKAFDEFWYATPLITSEQQLPTALAPGKCLRMYSEDGHRRHLVIGTRYGNVSLIVISPPELRSMQAVVVNGPPILKALGVLPEGYLTENQVRSLCNDPSYDVLGNVGNRIEVAMTIIEKHSTNAGEGA